MVVAELIDEHVSEKQCDLAVSALLKHVRKAQEKKQEFELLGKEEYVWLVVTTKKMQPEHKLKPHRIPIVHPLVDPRTSGICLITKDPQREYKDLLEEKKIHFISRVVGVSKLKGKFKAFEARRLLLKENGLFLADDRVIPLLPGLLGKKFFDAKKQPIPVKLTAKDLKSELERAISSTYFHQNRGTCISVKIGTLEHTAQQILANLKTALPHVAKAVKGGWESIQSLHIKTSSSISLPIWTCTLGNAEGGRWDGLTAPDDAAMLSGEESEDDMDVEVEESVRKAIAKAATAEKGKKRAAEEEATIEKPKKKAKAAKDSNSAAQASKTVSPAEVPAKKKRKAGVSNLEASAPAVETPATVAPKTNPSAPSTDVIRSKKKERKRKPATADDSAPSVSPASTIDVPAEPAIPVTPTAARQKKPRASTIDFFDETEATPSQNTSIAPPPNTPASGLPITLSPTKKRRKHKGGVEDTPVSGAAAKLSADPAVKALAAGQEQRADVAQPAEPVSTGDAPSKKQRRKKRTSAMTERSTDDAGAEATVPSVKSAEAPSAKGATESVPPSESDAKEKKKRRKHKKAEAASDAIPASEARSTGPTVEEVKQKRSTTSAEKKKEKVAKGKRGAGGTVKESLLGVKGLAV